MTKQTILLVDDQFPNLEGLEHLLKAKQRTFLKAQSGKEAIKIALNGHKINLIMLDVNMPGMSGFEVAEVLKADNKTKQIPLIFLTGVKKEQKSVLRGYAEGAVDYLMKPVDPEIIKAKVNVLLSLYEKNETKPQQEINQDHIFIKSQAKYVKVSYKDIYWFEAKGDYVMLHTKSTRHILHSTMKKLEDKLPAAIFMRVHRSYVVNVQHIASIQDFVLKIDDVIIPVGKSYQSKVMEMLPRL